MNVLWIVLAAIAGLVIGGFIASKINTAFMSYMMAKEMKKGNLYIYNRKEDKWMPHSPIVGFVMNEVKRVVNEDGEQGLHVKAEADRAVDEKMFAGMDHGHVEMDEDEDTLPN